jgi:hypothetical protein
LWPPQSVSGRRGLSGRCPWGRSSPVPFHRDRAWPAPPYSSSRPRQARHSSPGTHKRPFGLRGTAASWRSRWNPAPGPRRSARCPREPDCRGARSSTSPNSLAEPICPDSRSRAAPRTWRAPACFIRSCNCCTGPPRNARS